MLLSHCLGLASSDIQACPKRALLDASQRFATKLHQLPCIVLLNCSSSCIKRSEFIAGCLSTLHAGEERVDASVIAAPKVVGDCGNDQYGMSNSKVSSTHSSTAHLEVHRPWLLAPASSSLRVVPSSWRWLFLPTLCFAVSCSRSRRIRSNPPSNFQKSMCKMTGSSDCEWDRRLKSELVAPSGRSDLMFGGFALPQQQRRSNDEWPEWGKAVSLNFPIAKTDTCDHLSLTKSSLIIRCI